MTGYINITLTNEMGTFLVYFLPSGGIRVVRQRPGDLIEFDMKLQKNEYVYDSGIASNFINCDESTKNDIIVSLEKMVNEWIKNNVVSKFNIDLQLCRMNLESSGRKVRDLEKTHQDLEIHFRELVLLETKNMEEINNEIKRISDLLLETKRNSLQKE